MITKTTRTGDALAHLTGYSATVSAIVGAIDLNTVQVWTGAIVAVGAAFWGFWRDQKRRDWEAEERKKWIGTMLEANIAAAEKGLPLPFPQLDAVLMKKD